MNGECVSGGDVVVLVVVVGCCDGEVRGGCSGGGGEEEDVTLERVLTGGRHCVEAVECVGGDKALNMWPPTSEVAVTVTYGTGK